MITLKYTTLPSLLEFIERQGSMNEAIAEANSLRRMQVFQSESYKKWDEIEKVLISLSGKAVYKQLKK